MGNVAAIIGLPSFFVMALTIGTLVGAIILRAAVSLYNKMVVDADLPRAVPEPPIGKAMGITFVTTLVNTVVGSIVGSVIGGAAAAVGARGGGVGVTAQLVSFSITALFMAGMLCTMLPTTFGRAILVTLCHFLIVIIIVGIVVVIGLFA